MKSRYLLNEELEQGVLTFVVFNVSTFNIDKRRSPNMDVQKLLDFLNQYNLKCLPRYLSQKLGEGKKRKFACVIFAPKEYSENFEIFKRRYGDNGVNSYNLFEDFINNLSNKYGLKQGEQFFVIERKLRNTSVEVSGEENENLNRKCLLVHKNLLDRGKSGDNYLADVIVKAISKLNYNQYRNTYAEVASKNSAIQTLLKAGKLGISSLLFNRDEPGKSSGEGKIGVLWKYSNTPYYVVQFKDKVDELYYLILDIYNNVGGKEVGSTKKIKGIDTYYGLYSLHGEVGGAYGQRGQVPDVWVDYALFNDIQDLKSWVKEAGEDAWAEYEKARGELKSTAAGKIYRLAAALTGNEYDKSIKDTIVFDPRKFEPALKEIESEDTIFHEFATRLCEEIENCFGYKPLKSLTPPDGSVYKEIFNKLNIGEYSRNGTEFIDLVAADLIKRYKNIWSGKKDIDRTCSRGFIKKLINWYVMQHTILPRMKEISGGSDLDSDESEELDESRVFDTNEIEGLVFESVRRILKKRNNNKNKV